GGSGTRAITTASGVVTIGDAATDSVTGAGVNLTINSGSATTTVNAALNNIATLTLGSSSQTGTMTVNNTLSAASLVTGSTAYNIVLNSGDAGTSTITNAVTFANTTTLTLGDQLGDVFLFLGGLNATTQSMLNLAGTIRTAGNTVTLGNATSQAYIIYDTLIDTTNDAANPTGAVITFAGAVDNITSVSAALASDWTGGITSTLSGTVNWGDVIGYYGQGESVSRTFVLSGAGTRLDFNFYRLDSWDGERFQIYANDVLIVNEQFYYNTWSTTPITGSSGGYSWTFTPWVGDVNRNNVVAGWNDQRYTVELNVPAGITSLPLRFTSTLNQARDDESWAVSGFASQASSTSGLTLNSGLAVISSSAVIGSAGALKNLTVTNSGGTTFTGSVNISDKVSITNTTAGATVAFNGGLTTATFETSGNGYNVQVLGTSSISSSAPTEFLNTGTIQLGTGASDQITFAGGLIATNPSLIKLAGTIISNGPASIGDTNTSVQLMGNAIINTSGASSATNRALSIGGS
ncbi:MAG: hypothetical protein J0651_04940, partial [Actinobacteria bacterium]|nr:hypothetical protein [Actinomycetota bacterium]